MESRVEGRGRRLGEGGEALEWALDRLAREGKVRLGLPDRPEAHRAAGLKVKSGLVERLIDEDRRES